MMTLSSISGRIQLDIHTGGQTFESDDLFLPDGFFMIFTPADKHV